jgi:cyclase
MARVIPVLLLNGKGLVKTINFKNPTYIGDPINAMRIFNEKEVDELILNDINASKMSHEPNFDLIKKIVSEAFMPIGYGGGINKLDHVKKLIDLGVEKIVLNSSANDYKLIEQAANIFGNQSIVISIDVKKNLFGEYKAFIQSGRTQIKEKPTELAINCVNSGAGEIYVHSIDRDGTLQGYDEKIIGQITSLVNVPIVALGGASSLDDIKKVILNSGASAAAGSLFIYKGKHKAVLLNYPGYEVIRKLLIS